MRAQPNLAAVAALIADPARATMLMALMDGRALPAGELAFAAGIAAPTASAHLARLVDGRLLDVEREGRHRYFRLAGPEVAAALEGLGALGVEPSRSMACSREGEELRFARSCYDHLAGQLGVAVTRALETRGLLARGEGKRFAVGPDQRLWRESLGIDVATIAPTRCGLARQCLDWTERRHHLAGPLGVRLLHRLCELGWLRRAPGSRVVHLTHDGRRALVERLGMTLPDA